jgi:hypothetical protein
MRSKKAVDYSQCKAPRLDCKHCGKEMKLTDFSDSTLRLRGPYHATYLYRCECFPDEVQVLPIQRYPKIGEYV